MKTKMQYLFKKLLIPILLITILIASYYLIHSKYLSFFQKSLVYAMDNNQSISDDTYKDFLPDDLVRPNIDTINIPGTSYDEFISEDLDNDVEVINIDSFTGLLVPELGIIKYKVNILEAGYYNMKIHYYPIEGRSSNIIRGLMINGEYQFKEARNIQLFRIFEDSFKVIDKRVEDRHDLRPISIEKNKWIESAIIDIKGTYNEPYLFYFHSGENIISLEGVNEAMVIGNIGIYQDLGTLSYQEYLTKYQDLGISIKDNDLLYKVQAESSYEHNQSTLLPMASFNSYKIDPYEKFLTRYNTIGGIPWGVSGDWISWLVEVSEEGLYKITIKSLQTYSRGLNANRKLFINGVIPFSECYNLRFKFDNDWQNTTLGSAEEDYYFYFKEGINEIKLQNTIGEYSEMVDIMEEVIVKLNWIYRKVIMRTGLNPSKHQDFKLYESIENLKETINECIQDIEYVMKELTLKSDGKRSNLISPLDTTLQQLKDFLKSERNIQSRLNSLESNITSIGTWIMNISNQPLLIDYLLVHGDEAVIEKASINFFQRFFHECVLLINSYRVDTSLKSSVDVDGETITVWIMTGRDQANLMRSMIDQTFTTQNNINVELKLVSSAVLLKAILSGNGPDVAIGVAQNIPVNWGVRGALVDLSKLDGFNEFSESFHQEAITPFIYQGSVYALPDTQDFEVQFIRTDIFRELELTDNDGTLKLPNTWDEVLDLLPDLQRRHLDYYIPNVRGTLSPLLYALIKQYGGNLYINDFQEIGLSEEKANTAFQDFVNFYRNYGFQVEANFVNRFRTGEMPIGVANFTMHNTLAISAPELSGNWEFSMLPGTYNGDELNRSTTSISTGTIITSSAKNVEAAWKYVKWWLGEDAQSTYAKGMESILGAAARYPTANLAAFKKLPWRAKDYYILEEQRKEAVGIPTVPGDYIVGRYIDNAFRKIINEGINPSDVLYNYVLKINAELKRKQKEMGLR